MSRPLSTALIYARCGVVIFPCQESGVGGRAKAPYVHGGWHSATCNEEQICRWWTTWPDAVIGLPCSINRIVAIDADRHGHGDGVTVLLNLLIQHGFDDRAVPCVKTPRGGRHMIFSRPSQMGETRGTMGQAIDVRDRGYIVAAGSVMADGGRYALEAGTVEQLAVAVATGTVPTLPRWLEEMMSKPKALNPHVPVHPINGSSLEGRLRGLVLKVVRSPKGERNAILHWAACRARELVEAGLIQAATAAAMLGEAGVQAGLTPSEVRATVRSGLQQSREFRGD